MRRFVIGLLALFRRIALAVRRTRGTTEDDLAARRVVSGQAWDEFCDTLKAAGASLNFPGAPRDAFNQAEGHRYLTRLTRAGLMALVEHADPRAPVLHRVAHETVKLGADNPDNYYQTAAISGAYTYRITGQRKTVTYLGFGTQAGHYGQGGGLPPTGYIEAGEIEMDPDGRFELILSTEPRAGNWLPMTSESGTLIVRQTFLDRQTEIPADLHIQRIDCTEEERSPTPLTPAQIEQGLRSVSTLVAGASLLFAKWARSTRSTPRPISLRSAGGSNDSACRVHWRPASASRHSCDGTPKSGTRASGRWSSSPGCNAPGRPRCIV